ncbi:hypothetical protein MMC22_008182 [Lobaria immixta]|nr:hypothetical protein [Lobaria immixta]
MKPSTFSTDPTPDPCLIPPQPLARGIQLESPEGRDRTHTIYPLKTQQRAPHGIDSSAQMSFINYPSAPLTIYFEIIRGSTRDWLCSGSFAESSVLCKMRSCMENLRCSSLGQCASLATSKLRGNIFSIDHVASADHSRDSSVASLMLLPGPRAGKTTLSVNAPLAELLSPPQSLHVDLYPVALPQTYRVRFSSYFS